MKKDTPKFSDREQEIARILRENPAVSQAEVGRQLGISRQAVSSHLENMERKFTEVSADA